MFSLFAIEVILIQCNTWSSFTFLDVDKILYNTINSAMMKQDLNEKKKSWIDCKVILTLLHSEWPKLHRVWPF